MALVSGLYRCARSDGYLSTDERRRRLKVLLRRLVVTHGVETVRERIRAARLKDDEEPLRAWVLLHLE